MHTHAYTIIKYTTLFSTDIYYAIYIYIYIYILIYIHGICAH